MFFTDKLGNTEANTHTHTQSPSPQSHHEESLSLPEFFSAYSISPYEFSKLEIILFQTTSYFWEPTRCYSVFPR